MKRNISSTQRGYGSPHIRRRRQLLAQHTEGAPCEVCQHPMYTDPTKNWDRAPLEADHPPGYAQKYAANKKGNLPRRLLHRHCNRSGGAWDKPPPPTQNKPPTQRHPFQW